MENSETCFLCKCSLDQSIDVKFVQLNRILCKSCNDHVLKNKPEFIPINCSISESFHGPISNCSTHNKLFKLLCLTCTTLICSKCAVLHSGHSLELLSSTLSSIFSNLRSLELSILHTQARHPSEPVQSLLSEFQSFYASLQTVSTKELISSRQQILCLYKSLISLDPDFSNVPVEYSEDLCRLGRHNLTLLSFDPALVHVEWGERSVHIYDCQTYTETTQLLPSQHSALLYCRTVNLPFGQVFMCGGRKTAADLSLPYACIIYFEDGKVKFRQVGDMVDGRSNHLVVYCNDFVYVIGGLSSKNIYTKKCMRWSLKTETWGLIADISEDKDTLGGCCDVIREVIFVLGGKNSECCFAVEKYVIGEDRWETLSFITPYDCCLHGVFYFPHNQSALIFAGQNEAGAPITSSCMINFETGENVIKSNLPSKGGPVTEQPLWSKGKILALIFEGFFVRKLLSYDVLGNRWKAVLEPDSNENS